MNNKQKALFDIIKTFLEGEYGYDMDEFELKEDLIKNLKSDCVPIAASDFGETTDFSGATVYIPSQNAIVKDVYSNEFDESFQEKLHFKNLEAFQTYLYRETFDGLLAPEIDEEVLVEIVNSA